VAVEMFVPAKVGSALTAENEKLPFADMPAKPLVENPSRRAAGARRVASLVKFIDA
jgi:hypothetical protein